MTTPIDVAFAAMLADPEDDAARLSYYEQLADGEMFVLLAAEAAGETLAPKVFELEDGPVVLAFDLEERLSAFTGMPAPYAALPGRVIAAQLAGQGVGLAVNLGVEASAWIVTPEAVDWLAQMVTAAPDRVEARPVAFQAPFGLPPALLRALETRLARAGGLAAAAVLAGVEYEGGRRGHMLAFLGATEGAQEPLARAAAEALAFSGLDAGEMDVTFLSGDGAAAAALRRQGLHVPLPARPEPAPTGQTERSAPKAPGTDPDRPPRLR